MTDGALAGVTVLDFTAQLPGPLATLFLADAGAEVIKIERPGEGEVGRADDAVFAMRNRGKRSIAIDLKQDSALLNPLVERADVLIEQFRPGVMDRLGLGYEAVRAINPRVIYVSLNGYGSEGPDRLRPGHDLTYSAEIGLLALNADADGNPVMPSALAADTAGGSFAALSNILLALYRRERTGEGARLDVAMITGALAMIEEPLAHHFTGRDPQPRYNPSLGSSPRYNIYRTRDGRHLACAPAEEKFWVTFCALVGLPESADVAMVKARIAEREAAEWMRIFDGHEVCCSLVATVLQAAASPRIRRLLNRETRYGTIMMPALPSVFDPSLLAATPVAAAPELGEMNGNIVDLQG